MASRKRVFMAVTGMLAIVAAGAAMSAEIFHWIDENGVHHYSQTAPDRDTQGVRTMELQKPGQGNYDPEADIYGVEAQQERMQAHREELEQKRQAARERKEKQQAQQPVVIYRQPERWGYPIYRPGLPELPPLRPTPPVARPPSTLLPNPPVARPPNLP